MFIINLLNNLSTMNKELLSNIEQIYIRIKKQEDKTVREIFGLPALANKVLSLLSEFKNLNQNKIAQSLLVSDAAVSKIIQKLQDKDLIEKTIQSNNRRAFVIRLTEKGKKMSQAINRSLNFELEDGAGLTQAEQKKLLDLLSKVKFDKN